MVDGVDEFMRHRNPSQKHRLDYGFVEIMNQRHSLTLQ